MGTVEPIANARTNRERVQALLSSAYKSGNLEGYERGKREGYDSGFKAGEACERFEAAGVIARAKDRMLGLGLLIGTGFGVVGTVAVLGFLS